MQMIAEIYGVMRDGLGMAPKAIAEVFDKWNKGTLNSYLIEITAEVLAAEDPKTGKPLVDLILDQAGQKGTGLWSAIDAQISAFRPPPLRLPSRRASLGHKDERVAAEAPMACAGSITWRPTPDRQAGAALFAGKIVAYAQGFAVLEAASKEFGWNLPLATIARIWRAGCIIRSHFLDTIAAAYANKGLSNLLMAPDFIAMMKGATPASQCRGPRRPEGLPIPALSSALAYFDGYRQARGTANLIQAQRDFFGAHGFERLDAEGHFTAMGSATNRRLA